MVLELGFRDGLFWVKMKMCGGRNVGPMAIVLLPKI